MLILSVFIFLYWLLRGSDLIVGTLFGIPRLKDAAVNVLPSTTPKVSIIFAARNEAKHVGEAAKQMLAQDYPHLEVIAVNDRSEDETLSILQSIQDARLKIVDIKDLPKGWLGKTHALYQGYQAASGEWLLFTDADIKFKANTVSSAVCAAKIHGLDHLALFPKAEIHNYFELLFVTYFSLTFNMRFRVWAAKQKNSKAYVGIGAFNMVTRSAYEKIGTHQSLALDIADDMMLGKRIKNARFHQMIMSGDAHIRLRWVEGVRGVLNSLHKNGFRGLDYNFYFLLIATAGMLTIDVLPFIGLFICKGAAFAFFASAVACIGIIYLAGSRSIQASILAFPAHAFGSLLFAFILWRSAWTALRDGGVGWRGTMYPLDELRRNSEKL